MTISSGTATFSETQVGNIGVGDRVTYNTNSIAYISGKISQSQWTLVTATGGTPVDVSGQAVNSIKREYASLFDAEAGASDADHISNTSLVAADVVLNLPCYYDTGADTTAVTIADWTTDDTRYIKIYTPNDTATEANYNQRHSGYYPSDNKYQLSTTSTSISNDESYTQIIGLSIKTTGNYLILNSANEMAVSVIVSSIAGFIDTTGYGGGMQQGSSGSMNVYNSSIYSRATYDHGRASAFWVQTGTLRVYNCTSVGGRYGIYRHTGTLVAKNNLAKGAVISNYSGTFDVTSNYNASGDASSTGGANDRISQVFTFVNEANNNFHLSPADAGAKNFGTDLSGDPVFSFTTDIDSQSRTGLNWDIGADEATFNGPFTIQAWVRPDATPATKTIIAKAEEMRLATDASGKPLCQIKSGQTWQTAAVSGDALSVSQWTHISCSYDQTNLKIYVNGVEKGSQALTVGVDNMTSNWKIGTDDSSDGTYGEWNGLIDDFQFYNYARQPEELIEDINAGHPAGGSPISSPITDYNFDEGVSGSAHNKGNGGSVFDGMLQPGSGGSNTSATQMWSLDGYNGKAVELDGTDDKVDLPDVSY